MAYKYQNKENAKELYIQGYNVSEIHRLLKINRGTLIAWKKKYKWDELKSQYDLNIRNKLELSKQDRHKEILKNIISQSEYLLKELS